MYWLLLHRTHAHTCCSQTERTHGHAHNTGCRRARNPKIWLYDFYSLVVFILIDICVYNILYIFIFFLARNATVVVWRVGRWLPVKQTFFIRVYFIHHVPVVSRLTSPADDVAFTSKTHGERVRRIARKYHGGTRELTNRISLGKITIALNFFVVLTGDSVYLHSLCVTVYVHV